MAAPLIPIVLQLAQFAPAIMRYFGAGKESTAVAERVVEAAAAVTGGGTPEEILQRMQADAQLQAQFRQRMAEMDHQLEIEYLQDVKDARARDTKLAELGRKNWRPDIMFVLAVGVISALVFMIWKSPDINEYMKGIFTLVLGRFLGYLDNIYNFEFGSTRTSRTKDTTIEQLSKR